VKCILRFILSVSFATDSRTELPAAKQNKSEICGRPAGKNVRLPAERFTIIQEPENSVLSKKYHHFADINGAALFLPVKLFWQSL
jgi:hypothetical protein